MKSRSGNPRPTYRILVTLATALLVTLNMNAGIAAGSTPPQVAISQIPLTLVIPAHPQVMVIVGNSESMDGNVSGAIMVGSGAGTTVTDLNGSSSPLEYAVPSGFTPPLKAADSTGYAYYTVDGSGNTGINVSGTQYDNSDSRMNVTKASISKVLDTYAATTDFGLMDYDTSSVNEYTTWVYYMSDSGGFTATSFNSNNTPPSGDIGVLNPCGGNTGADAIGIDCNDISQTIAPGNSAHIGSGKYAFVTTTSDDPSVNDVLYANGLPSVFMAYNGPNPGSPYPPNFSLTDYETGSVSISYYDSAPNIGGFGTGPTNAGYVPYSPAVLYAQRGFGYGSSVSSDTGNLLVGISSAGTGNTSPTQTQLNTYLAQFTGYLKPETNDKSTSEIKSSAGQSPLAGPLKQTYEYYTGTGSYSSPPPSNNSCSVLRFVVLITDGLPTEDLAGNHWPPLGSAAASGYGVTASFKSDGSLDTTNDQALTDTIAELTALEQKGIKTYVVGVGAGVDPTTNPDAAKTMTAMAIAGGTGDYFAASSPSAVATQLDSILSKIEAQNLATTAAAVNSTGLHTGTDVYQAKYSSNDTYGDWTGDLLAFPIDANTGLVDTSISNAQWRFQTQLDSQAWNTAANPGVTHTRLIATCNPNSSGICANGSGIPFEWGTGSSAAISSTSTLGLELMTSSSDTLGEARLDYLRGDPSNYKMNGGTFRDRTHLLGDIVDSNPLYIGAPNGSFTDSAYATFKGTWASREPVIYVGANDGMLHAVDANTGYELFSYIPNGVFANLINLTKPTYNQSHQFFVDGSPTASDVQFSDGTWHTIVVGGLSGGGKSVYALDVTDPASITSEAKLASDVLWDFTDTNLGMTYSRPYIADTDNGFEVFFGSGYDNGGDDYLYILNAETGAVVQKIDLCTSVSPSPCSNSLPNGVSSPVVVNSGGAIGTSNDTVYVGDLQGNLFKISLPNVQTGANSYTVSLIFQARNSSGTDQPITTAPVVSLHPDFPTKTGLIVYFGTGQFLGTGDITNTDVQSFYAVWDDSPNSAYTRSNLVQQKITDASATICVTQPAPNPCVNTTETVRTVTGNTIDWSTNKGFYLDLGSAVNASDTGERVISDPRLVNGSIVFTTYIPSTNSCTGGGQAFLMDLNYKNLGTYPKPQLDLNGDTKLNNSDQINGNNPVGLSLGAVYASSPTVITASMGNVGAVKLIAKSTGQIQTVGEAPPPSSLLSWRQIQ